MKKPLIGITLDNEDKGGYSKFPWYAIRHNYLHSIEKYGGIPFPLYHSNKNTSDETSYDDANKDTDVYPHRIFASVDIDLTPKLKMVGEVFYDPFFLDLNQRTNFEIAITKKFLKSSKPILGICGGAQLLNVVCGGTLIQDIKKNNLFPINHEQKNPRNETSHKIEIISKTLLAKINKKKFSKVNSAHHQAIKDIGKNIIISSYAPDGIIESIEHKHHKWCIGVQWHPEFLITKEDKNLIKNFIKNTKK